MKNLLRNWLILAVMIVGFTSCNKDTAVDDSVAAKYVDMKFDLEALGEQFSGLSDALNKNAYTKGDGTPIQYPLCTEDEASYVEVTMDGTLYTITFTALSPSQTEVIKVLAGDHTITEFEVFSADGTPIYSAPHVGSDDDDIATYGLIGLPYTFELTEFTKTKIDIDVICWHDYSYQPLAWNWFELNYNQKKTLAFFGNICSKFYADWGATGYDFVGPIHVILKSDGDVIAEGYNYDPNAAFPQLGVGEVKIEYIDNELEAELLTAEIYYVDPAGNLVLVDTIAIDEGAWSEIGPNGTFGGDDGIFDFQVGNCTDSSNDGEYPAYMPIPTSGQFMHVGAVGDGYVGVNFRNLVGPTSTLTIANTSVSFPTQPMWCAAKDDIIYNNVWYNANFYNSLDPAHLAQLDAKYGHINWDALNWIINNKGGFTSAQIQAAIWHFTDGKAGNSLSIAATSAGSYSPPVGGFAIVIVDAIESDKQRDIQLMVVSVDP